jgi:hypothetical protein
VSVFDTNGSEQVETSSTESFSKMRISIKRYKEKQVQVVVESLNYSYFNFSHKDYFRTSMDSLRQSLYIIK